MTLPNYSGLNTKYLFSDKYLFLHKLVMTTQRQYQISLFIKKLSHVSIFSIVEY